MAHRGPWRAAEGVGAIVEHVQYTLFLLLMMNINGGLASDSECLRIERTAPHPVIACGSTHRERHDLQRNYGGDDKARVVLISGANR